MKTLAVFLLAGAASAPAAAQAVTEWRAASGLPVAVVEVAGGDLEHLAAVVPMRAPRPAAVAGWPLAVAEREGAAVWSLRVPAAAATQAAVELAPLLAAAGCSALAAVGPAPVRELRGPLAALDAVVAAALPPPCALADGRSEIVRGTPERVELVHAVPPPADPRFDGLPLLAAVLERRLAGPFPGVRVAVERRDGCWRLVTRLDPGEEAPRAAARRLRSAVAAAGAAAPDAGEVAAAAAPLRRAAMRLVADGAEAAVAVAERLAQGGRAAGTLAPPPAAPDAVAALLRETIAARAGLAVLTEAERRTRLEEPETLAGGAILTTRWLVEDLGVLALALGGVDPGSGRRVAGAAAERLAAAGWRAAAAEVVGLATVKAVLPPEDLPEALEALAATLVENAPAAAERDLADDVAAALGLLGAPAAESVSVALALPPEVDEGVEAGRKFLATLPAGGVRSSAPLTGAPLVWSQDAGSPRLAAVAELPPSADGWLAGEVLAARAARDGTLRAAWMSPPGGLALVIAGEGEASVPELDTRLARAWTGLRSPAAPEEVAEAGRRLHAALYGDLPEAMVRAALRPFLPAVPAEIELLAADVRAVSAALGALPPWQALRRVARGPAPAPPPVRKSRQSSSRQPGAAATSSPREDE
jgi:hypothetical protein